MPGPNVLTKTSVGSFFRPAYQCGMTSIKSKAEFTADSERQDRLGVPLVFGVGVGRAGPSFFLPSARWGEGLGVRGEPSRMRGSFPLTPRASPRPSPRRGEGEPRNPAEMASPAGHRTNTRIPANLPFRVIVLSSPTMEAKPRPARPRVPA